MKRIVVILAVAGLVGLSSMSEALTTNEVTELFANAPEGSWWGSQVRVYYAGLRDTAEPVLAKLSDTNYLATVDETKLATRVICCSALTGNKRVDDRDNDMLYRIDRWEWARWRCTSNNWQDIRNQTVMYDWSLRAALKFQDSDWVHGHLDDDTRIKLTPNLLSRALQYSITDVPVEEANTKIVELLIKDARKINSDKMVIMFQHIDLTGYTENEALETDLKKILRGIPAIEENAKFLGRIKSELNKLQ